MRSYILNSFRDIHYQNVPKTFETPCSLNVAIYSMYLGTTFCCCASCQSVATIYHGKRRTKEIAQVVHAWIRSTAKNPKIREFIDKALSVLCVVLLLISVFFVLFCF